MACLLPVIIEAGELIRDFAGNERFEVLTRLGQGGMGSVYQVVDRTRNARVALKSVGRVSGDALLRFKREFRALQEIRHPNLLELGELFELHQTWFFTMELIDGVDFAAHVRSVSPWDGSFVANDTWLDAKSKVDAGALRGRPMAPRSVGFDEARLRKGLAGLVSGVAALHARGLLHRDLKPANVLVTEQGRVVVIDFGLVTGPEHSVHTTEHHVMGTVAYMAPEQAAGENVGPASDWYAVGAMLYECLTGVLPIDDSTLRLMMRKQVEVPRPPSALVADVPPDLEALCMALLEIDPQKRPSVQDIFRRLHVEGERPLSPASASLSVAGLPEVFVGREAELARIQQAVARTRQGRQSSVKVVGPSGVGKSALLRRVEAELAKRDEGYLILRGQCREHETVPFKALDGVMDALSKWLKSQPNELVLELLPDEAQLIASTFTVLERVPAVRTARRTARVVKDPQEKRLSLLAGVRELFRRVALQRRTVLVLEDMQWSDEDSFLLLRELMRAPDAPALTILYTGQPELSERASLVEGARRIELPVVEEMVLRPLAAGEALELARRIGPRADDGRTLDRIVTQAEGYPFLIEALVQASLGKADAAHEGGTDTVLGRLFTGLKAPARALLEVISLAGFPITKGLAADAASLGHADVLSEFKFLRAARWLRTGGPLMTDLVEPSHDRVRRAVLDTLDDERKRALHHALAMALEEARAEPDKVAHHYTQANEPRKARKYLRMAAQRALDALAFDRAATLLQRLMELHAHEPDEERELLTAWGDALASAGRGLEAAQVYLRAIPLSSTSAALDLKRRVAEQYLISGRFDDGMNACGAFLGDLDIEPPATPRGAFLELVYLRARVSLRGLSFKAREPEQIAQEELARIDALWSMAKGLASHDLIRSQVFQTRGLLRALSTGEPYRVSRALALEYVNMLVQNPKATGRAEAALAQSVALAEQLKSPHALGLSHFCRGLGIYAAHCRWLDALDAMERGLSILRSECRDVAWEVSQSIQIVANCRMYMGHFRELRVASRDCQNAEARGDLYLGLMLRGHVLSFLSLLEDQPARAMEDVRQAFRPLERAPSPIDRFNRELAALRVLQYSGQVDEILASLAQHRKGLVDTLLMGAPIIRLLSNEMSLRNVLLAAELDRERKLHLGKALKLARTLETDGIATAVPAGQLGRAAIAFMEGRKDEALSWLIRAEQGFSDHDRAADVAATRRRRGQILGGDEGRALVTSAESWFVSEGTRNIPALCRLVAPGFPGLDD